SASRGRDCPPATVSWEWSLGRLSTAARGAFTSCSQTRTKRTALTGWALLRASTHSDCRRHDHDEDSARDEYANPAPVKQRTDELAREEEDADDHETDPHATQRQRSDAFGCRFASARFSASTGSPGGGPVSTSARKASSRSSGWRVTRGSHLLP